MRKGRLVTIWGHSFIDALAAKPTIVDLGACGGRFAGELKRTHPGARMVLVEPNPALARKLERTVGRMPHVRVVNVATGSVPEPKVNFYLSKNPEASSFYPVFAAKCGLERGCRVTVERVTLRGIMSRLNVRKIHLLKVDIEGAEWDVLASMAAEDCAQIDQISVEFHDFIDPKQRVRTLAAIRKLKRLGYSLWRRGLGYSDCLFYRPNLLRIRQPSAEENREKIAWFRRARLAKRDLLALIRPGRTFILVDDDKLPELVGRFGPRAVPFTKVGPPPNDATAIRRLERLRRSGACFLVVAWPAFWWLDYYSGLRRYLRSRFRSILANERLVVFDLQRV